MNIRPAEPRDVPALITMVRELAEYEKAPEQAIATQADFARDLFGESPRVHALVVEVSDEVVAYAFYFLNYSTWLGRHGIYLEDLYVRPAFRGEGSGKALLIRLAQECVEKGYGRLDWSVLDWNTPSRDFYAGLGAEGLTEWVPYRVEGNALANLARLGN
ncbi:MAG: GNAT family N-acetyltransferase [Candidatus Nanopelagicales bacterium]